MTDDKRRGRVRSNHLQTHQPKATEMQTGWRWRMAVLNLAFRKGCGADGQGGGGCNGTKAIARPQSSFGMMVKSSMQFRQASESSGSIRRSIGLPTCSSFASSVEPLIEPLPCRGHDLVRRPSRYSRSSPPATRLIEIEIMAFIGEAPAPLTRIGVGRPGRCGTSTSALTETNVSS